MSVYKMDRCPSGINSQGMTRVLHHHSLVAVFSSYEDATNFIAMKELQKEKQRLAAKEQAK